MLLLVNRILLHCNKTTKNKRARRLQLVVQKQFSQQIFIFETVFLSISIYTCNEFVNISQTQQYIELNEDF